MNSIRMRYNSAQHHKAFTCVIRWLWDRADGVKTFPGVRGRSNMGALEILGIGVLVLLNSTYCSGGFVTVKLALALYTLYVL